VDAQLGPSSAWLQRSALLANGSFRPDKIYLPAFPANEHLALDSIQLATISHGVDMGTGQTNLLRGLFYSLPSFDVHLLNRGEGA
jgi:hypothetical protein